MFMIRKTYTVSSWDKEAGLGYATDGTSWEGSPILFPIYAKDVEEYEGYLAPGEIITAVEPIGDYPNPEWHLIDIIVESGPRCANFSSALSIVMSPPDEPVTRDQYLELIARIEDLEYRVYCDDSE